VTCPRCGQPAVEELIDCTMLCDPAPRTTSNGLHCPDPDCVDPFGRNEVEPPNPAELQAIAHRGWLAHQRQLTT
jgi:hypothetical protein